MTTTHTYQLCAGRERQSPSKDQLLSGAVAGFASMVKADAVGTRSIVGAVSFTRRVTLGAYDAVCSFVGDIVRSSPVQDDVLLRSWYR